MCIGNPGVTQYAWNDALPQHWKVARGQGDTQRIFNRANPFGGSDWKCAHCGSKMSIAREKCTQCGAPPK